MQYQIHNASAEELDLLLQAVLGRWRELYPDWDIMVMSIDKKKEKNDQIDRIIAMLENLKDQ